ncbi:helix-turn-helix domain-containing protein [Pseudodesulfovibrio methanolicus]|uniref:Helix-turn-helix transcriptional regulator n=1 Tax=Pseudodesulfovibrio methanolicus TaxID=3126690 RepID=A0ABZ2J000_9BACT
MKSAQQKLVDDVGIYLSVVRKRKGLTQESVARKLGHTTSNFVSRVEKGKGPIPVGKIGAFAEAYGISSVSFGRLVLAAMHPEVYETFLMLLKLDEPLTKAAAGCHGVKEKTRHERERKLETLMRRDALDEMWGFLAANRDFLPKNTWSKRAVEWTSIENIE